MKKPLLVYYLLILVFYCFSCKRLPAEKSHLVFEDSLSAIVDSFLQEYPNKKIYELYIDKKGPHRSILMLFGGDRSRTFQENGWYHQNPLIQISYKGKVIYVYSGAERYIYKKNEIINNDIIPKSKVHRKSRENERCWVIIDHLDTIKVLKNYNSSTPYPFMRVPVEFKAPKIPSPKINQNPDTTNK